MEDPSHDVADSVLPYSVPNPFLTHEGTSSQPILLEDTCFALDVKSRAECLDLYSVAFQSLFRYTIVLR